MDYVVETEHASRLSILIVDISYCRVNLSLEEARMPGHAIDMKASMCGSKKNKGRQKAAQFNLVLGREEYGRGASVSLRDHPNLVRFRAVLYCK